MMLLDSVPEYKLGYVAAFLLGLIIGEEADSAFYERKCHQEQAGSKDLT